MTESSFAPDWFSKPGDTLSHLLRQKRYSPGQLANRMGCTTEFVNGLLAGTMAIDDAVAACLEQHVGGTASFWLMRQAQFDKALSRIVDSIPAHEAKAWLRNLPLREMIKNGWVPEVADNQSAIKAVLAFFGVGNPVEWGERYTNFENMFSFRTSPSFASKAGSLAAWLRKGEIEADGLFCENWDPLVFNARLDDIRNLTKAKAPSYFIPRLRSICASCGVAVVFVRAPSGCRASGATRFLSPEKAVIVLSFRYLSDDHFWFSFFHEAGHLLLHGETSTFVDGEGSDQIEKEAEANRFAAGILIPHVRRDELMGLPARTKPVLRFATSIGISPGIVVGQMQHNSVAGPNQLNHLKRRYSWEEISSALSSL